MSLDAHEKKKAQLFAKRRQQLATELSMLRAALRAEDTWTIGACLDRIFRGHLWQTPPYHRGLRGQWLGKMVPEVLEAAAYRYILVAQHFLKRDVEKFGHSRLAWLAYYEKARFGGMRVGNPGERLVHVPQPDGTWKQTTLSAGCTLSELRRATRASALRQKARGPARSAPR